MRISDWSSDVCSSDRVEPLDVVGDEQDRLQLRRGGQQLEEGGADGEAIGLLRRPHADGALEDEALLVGEELEGVDQRTDQVVEIGRASCRERVCQYV